MEGKVMEIFHVVPLSVFLFDGLGEGLNYFCFFLEFSQWILKIKVEKLLCTLPNSFLLSSKMPFSLPSFL